MKIHLLIIIAIIFIFSCKNESPQNFQMEKTDYLSWVNNLRIRQKPSLTSKVIGMLKKGEEVIIINDDENKKMDKFEKYLEVKLSGENVRSHWIKIKTTNNIIGWVFKGALSNISYINNYKIYSIEDTIYISSLSEKKIILKDKISTKIKNYQYYKFISNITVKDANPYIIIIPSPWIDPVNFYIGIFDTSSNTWNGKIYGYNHYIGLSPSKKYILVDNGTGATWRSTMIYSFKEKKSIYKFSPNFSTKWNADDSLNFKMKLFNSIRNLDYTNAKVQNVTWKEGKIIKKGKIEAAQFE